MKANTCLGLVAASLALWFLKNDPLKSSLFRIRLGKSFGVFILLLSTLTAMQFVLGLDFKIDELIVTDFGNAESSLFPGRMSPIACFCFFLYSISLLTLDERRIRKFQPSSFFILPLFLISFLVLVGYFYGENSFYQIGPYIRIAWQTALCFFILSVGLLFSRPQDGPVQILTSPGLGGVTARRLLPFVVIVPALFGWLWILARQADLISRAMGVSLFVISIVGIFIGLITFYAKRIDALEAKGKVLLQGEKKVQDRFFEVLAHAPLIVWSLDENANYELSEGFALNALGLSSGEVVGKNHFELFKENVEVCEHVRRAFRGEKFTAETVLNGRTYSTSYVPLHSLDGSITGLSAISNDVTELRLAAKQLELSDERFRQLSENLTDRVFHVMDLIPHERLTYVSPSFEKIWRMPLKTVYQNPRVLVEHVHPDDKNAFESFMQRQQVGESCRIEYRLLFEDGSVKWIRDSAVPVKDSSGRTFRVTGIAEDITEQKTNEENLKSAQILLAAEKYKLEQIFATSPAAMAMWIGNDLIFEQINPKYSALFGDRELLGLRLLIAIPELKGQSFDMHLRQVMKTGEPFIGQEFLARHSRFADGPIEDRYYDFCYIRIDDPFGKSVGVYAHAIDVTDKVLAKRALQEKTAFLQTVIEQMPMAVVFAEAPSGRLLFANSRIKSVWRHDFIPADSVEEYKEYIGFHADGRRFEGKDWPLAKAITEDRVVAEECDVQLGDGSRGTLRILAAPVHDGNGKMIAAIVISEDITDRKRREIELRDAKLEAENANIAKTQFLANMSHEIRTPVGAITGFSELLNTSKLSVVERSRYTKIIERNSQQLLRLIDDILDLSKVEAGKLVIEKEEFSLTDFISEFVSAMTFKAAEKGISFKLRFDGLIPNMICTDQVRLRQILVNLVEGGAA